MKSHHARTCFLTVLSILLIGFWIMPAQASPITYTFTAGDFFGVYNGTTEFNGGSFKIAIFGDTNDATVDGFGPINAGPGGIGLTGTISFSAPEVGAFSGTFLDPLFVFVDQEADLVGFGSVPGATDLLDMFAPGQGLDTYNLASFFGPITGTQSFVSGWVFAGGTTIDPEDMGTITFQAVPEPATMLLLGTALLGIWGIRRKQS
jgi:hypothetical protein